MSGKFEPKTEVHLNPPKDDPITVEELAKYDGSNPDLPIYVAMKGIVFDVSTNRAAYAPGKSYNVFAGKDASRALAKSSVKKEDAVPEWEDLTDAEKQVLNDWVTFFTKRYNIVGKVVKS